MFLQACVCPQGGGVCLSACWDAIPPRDQADQTPPPGTSPPPMENPLRDGEPPPGKQTPAYGLRAAGTHPTGMHSSSFLIFKRIFMST